MAGPTYTTGFEIPAKTFIQKLKNIIKRIPHKAEKALQENLKEAVEVAKTKHLSGPYPQKLTSRSGKLASSIDYITQRSGNKITAEFGVLTDVIYANIHEFGGNIKPVTAKSLHFIAYDGNEVFTKLVRMPARPYVWPALQSQIPKIERDLLEYGIEF